MRQLCLSSIAGWTVLNNTLPALNKIRWKHRDTVSMRKKKSDMPWYITRTDYVLVIAYQTNSFPSSPDVGSTYRIIHAVYNASGLLDSEFTLSAKHKRSQFDAKTQMLVSSSPLSWSVSIQASILADFQRSFRCLGIGLQKHNVMHIHRSTSLGSAAGGH